MMVVPIIFTYNGADNQRAVYCSVYSELKRKRPEFIPVWFIRFVMPR